VSTLPSSIQYNFGIPSHSNGGRNKRNSIRKEEVKLSLFADDVILYLKDPKNPTNTFSKVAGYKINIQNH
jgi:hypothetical protein